MLKLQLIPGWFRQAMIPARDQIPRIIPNPVENVENLLLCVELAAGFVASGNPLG